MIASFTHVCIHRNVCIFRCFKTLPNDITGFVVCTTFVGFLCCKTHTSPLSCSTRSEVFSEEDIKVVANFWHYRQCYNMHMFLHTLAKSQSYFFSTSSTFLEVTKLLSKVSLSIHLPMISVGIPIAPHSLPYMSSSYLKFIFCWSDSCLRLHCGFLIICEVEHLFICFPKSVSSFMNYLFILCPLFCWCVCVTLQIWVCNIFLIPIPHLLHTWQISSPGFVFLFCRWCCAKSFSFWFVLTTSLWEILLTFPFYRQA